MQSIVMDTSPLQGWTTSNYKSFKAVDESSESGSDSDSDSESEACLLYTSPSPRDYAASRMPSSA